MSVYNYYLLGNPVSCCHLQLVKVLSVIILATSSLIGHVTRIVHASGIQQADKYSTFHHIDNLFVEVNVVNVTEHHHSSTWLRLIIHI